jgi:thymidylate kinase
VHQYSSSVALVRQLGEELSRHGVRCHRFWSDSARENPDALFEDLELRVWRPDAQRFLEVLQRLGVKEARRIKRRGQVGVVHYYGYDLQSDCLIRIRTRFQPFGGDDTGIEPHRRSRWRRLAETLRLRRAEGCHSNLVSGGLLIALVGADGAGKSSAVDAIHRWLSPHLRVVRVHMGKPRWSVSTIPVKAVLKLIRVLPELRARLRSPTGRLQRKEQAGFGLLLWHTVTARDRYHAYRRARRLAEKGFLVICDRFPLSDIESMDGRRTGRLVPAPQSRLARKLIEWEESYYEAIAPPELLVVLRVDPDVALRRRPEDPETRVRERALEILEVDGVAMGAHMIDAGMPMTKVHRELKSWIWTRL